MNWSDFVLHAELDAGSLQRVAHLAGYQSTLEENLSLAMYDSVVFLHDDVVDFMDSHFANPTGALADTMTYAVDNPYQAWTGTDSPYGRRRDLGFTGMTDALGRYYPRDPGILWAEEVAAADLRKVERRFEDALQRTVLRLEGAI